MERPNITDDDEGKKVVDADGEEIGIITSVRSGTPFVDPSPGLDDRLMAKLGWHDVDEEDYALDEAQIDQVTDDHVRLSRDM